MAARFISPPYPHSAQDLFELCTKFHDAFSSRQFDRLLASLPEVEFYMPLLRPGEVAMMLNHLAKLPAPHKHHQAVARVWDTAGRHMPALMIDAEWHTVSIMFNAYAMSKRTNATEVLNTMVQTVPRLVDYLDARSVAMLVNAFARLNITDHVILELLARRVEHLAPQLNAIDVATVANGFAKTQYAFTTQVLDLLPIKERVNEFTPSHVAMVANAYGRVRHRNHVVARLLAERAWELTERGATPFPCDYLPSVVHALVTRLDYAPTALAQVVACTVPRIANDLQLHDLVLLLPPLARLPDLREMDSWWREIANRVVRDVTQLRGHALCGIIFAFAKLRAGDGAFWDATLRHVCSVNIVSGDVWDMERYASVGLALPPEVAALPCGQAFFDKVAETCHLHTWTPRAVANMALAFAKHELLAPKAFDFFANTAVQSVAAGGVWRPMDCAQLLWAVARFELRYDDLLAEFDRVLSEQGKGFDARAREIVFGAFRQLEFQPTHLRDEFMEFQLRTEKGVRPLAAEEIMPDT